MRQDHSIETRYDEAVQQREVVQSMPRAEWQEIDRRLREYARHRATLDAAELFDLARAEQLKVHYLHGHVHMYEYMERVLGYTPHAARERLRVARALGALPSTAAALARGELSYSGVRELTRVATADTEDSWLAASKGMVTNQIEKLVSGHGQGDRPDDPTTPDLRPRSVRLELPPEVYALWRQARMVLADERGTEFSDADMVETLCRAVIAPGSGAAGPAHQIAYQQCPDCRRATQNAAGREIDIAPEVIARVGCDARVLGSLDVGAPRRATQTVTPRVREQVFARDHGCCTVPGAGLRVIWMFIISLHKHAADRMSWRILRCCVVATTLHFTPVCYPCMARRPTGFRCAGRTGRRCRRVLRRKIGRHGSSGA